MKKPDETQSIINELLKSDLNANQAHFIKGIKKYYKHFGTLTEKQNSCLKSIYNTVYQKSELSNLLR